MVKPIRPTPTLYGKDAERFVRRMIKVENSPPSKSDIEFRNRFKKHKPMIDKYLNSLR